MQEYMFLISLVNKRSLKCNLTDCIENHLVCSHICWQNHVTLLSSFMNLVFFDKFPVLQVVQVTKNPD